MTKPAQRPQWMDEATYAQMPAELTVREVRVRVAVKGFRVRSLDLVTTLLDAQLYNTQELARAFRCRWHAELDLAYNLIRAVMAEAAEQAGVEPRQISFAGALQTLDAFAPTLRLADEHDLPRLWAIVLRAVARHRVGGRPDRHEPRAVKRRAKPIALLTVPREQARKRLTRAKETKG